jgi:class 3 adenylate cyclase/CheY-like chemotaxis protein
VRTPPRILIVDDQSINVDILQTRLAAHGYDILTATDGETALSLARAQQPDLILLDVMMPKMDGIEVCRRIKSDASFPFVPIIMITARADSLDIVAGLEAGAEEYLTKPVDQAALVARVKSMLRIKSLHDMVQEQAIRLEVQATQLVEWNHTLEQRVAVQVAELERLSRLKRFFSPQLAELIVSAGEERLLESHRREVTVVICDLRGFTAFSEAAAPEAVMGVLREYHAAMGELIFHYEGTLERFTGDGLMVFFNDPLLCLDPSARAVHMAVAMRQRVAELMSGWRVRGYHLDFGVGIAHGEATLGKIGFEGRFDYAAIGTVTNLAARLCGEAGGGQILISQQVYAAVENFVVAERVGKLALKGFVKPVLAFSIIELKD